MMFAASSPSRIGNPMLGWIIPAIVFLVSFVLTWMIYRHFARRM